MSNGFHKMTALTKKEFVFHLWIIFILVILTRILFLFSPVGQSIDADEAIFGLMAQKIAALEDFPIFFWEAHYGGTVISYLAAPFFRVFGSSLLILRLIMLLLALLSIFLFYAVYRKLFDPLSALAASVFLILCPFLFLYYTSIAVNYGETIFGTALILFMSTYIREGRVIVSLPVSFFCLGIVCGFYFYILFLVAPAILAFAVPTVWFFEKKRLRHFFAFSLGGLIGSTPFIFYNVMTSGKSFFRAGGRMFSVGFKEMMLSLPDFIAQILSNKIVYLKTWFCNVPAILGSYLLPETYAYPLLPIAGICLIAILTLFTARVLTQNTRGHIFYFHHKFALFVLFLFLFQWIANLNQPRHLLPLLPVIPVAFLTIAMHRQRLKYIALTALLSFSLLQFIGWYPALVQSRFDARPVAAMMKSSGISYFYGSYWTVYPIMFAGNGQISGSPLLLPFQEPFSDRLPKCTLEVRQSTDAAYVFTRGENDIENRFKRFIGDHQINYDLLTLSETRVYFNFSKPVDTFIDADGNSRFVLKAPLSTPASGHRN
jgi:4-amino-4-deoxy-L-arabinose transferase-like glycosyltransferase